MREKKGYRQSFQEQWNKLSNASNDSSLIGKAIQQQQQQVLTFMIFFSFDECLCLQNVNDLVMTD